MQKIVPNFWFDSDAEEAVDFYRSVFKDVKVNQIAYYTEVGQEIHGRQPGSVMTIDFEIEGFNFTALNGGPAFTPNPSISFFVNCRTKDEATEIWEKLSPDSQALMPFQQYPFSELYGWAQDKFGISWQINLNPEAPQKIMTSMMFVKENCGKAEEAMNFYASVFKNSKVGEISRYGKGQEPEKEGDVMYAELSLEGQTFAAMDSGQAHNFNFNEAISLLVNCQDQEEIDYYWGKLSAVPEAEQCGWIKDKYGVVWQIVPAALIELFGDGRSPAAQRTMDAMLKMKKLDLEELEKAHRG